MVLGRAEALEGLSKVELGTLPFETGRQRCIEMHGYQFVIRPSHRGKEVQGRAHASWDHPRHLIKAGDEWLEAFRLAEDEVE